MNKVFKNKKIFLLLLIFLIASSSCFAIPKFSDDPNSFMYQNNWDAPFVKGILSFGLALWNFRGLAIKLCTFFFFLNLCWQSFKLWFGTIEIKKVVIDIVYKLLMVTVLMNVYPVIVDGVLSMGSNIGMTYSNASGELAGQLAIIYEDCYQTSAQAMKKIEEIINSGDVKKLSKNDINKLANVMQMDPSQLEAKLKESNPEFTQGAFNRTGKTKLKTWQVLLAAGAGVAAGVGVIMAGPPILLGLAVVGAAAGATGVTAGLFKGANAAFDHFKNNSTKNRAKELNQWLENPDVENMMIIYKAFNDTFGQQVMTSEELKSMYHDGPSSEKAQKNKTEEEIKKSIASFVTNMQLDINYEDEDASKTFTTAILAPSAMIRLGLMECQVLRNKADIKVNKDIDGDGKSNFNFFTSDFMDFTKVGFLEISALLTKLILPWALMIPIIFCTLEYVVMILEYYMVTSIGVIFIPLLLFDPTKQYGAKLLHLFVSYFLKVLVTTWVCMWCLSNMLSTGLFCMTSNSFTFQVLAFAIFQMMLSLMISQQAPNIASVLLNGEGRMGFGTAMQTAHQVGHAVRSGMNMAKQASRSVASAPAKAENAIKTGYAAKGAIENAKQTTQARREAVNQAGQGFYKALRQNGVSAEDARTETKQFQEDFNKQMKHESKAARRAQMINGYNVNAGKKIDENPSEMIGNVGSAANGGGEITPQMARQIGSARASHAVGKKIEDLDKVKPKPKA